MEKQKKSRPQASTILLIAGTMIAVTTPFVQPIIIYFLTRGCPMLGDVRECGLEVGYKNAFYAENIPILWFVIGIIILAVGIIKYYIVKKRR
jgi:hypothetical protein